MGYSPLFASSPFLNGLDVFRLVVLASVVLLTVWTAAWRVYRQPTLGRLVEHGVLLLLSLWSWVLSGPHYREKWGNWVPGITATDSLVLARRRAH